MKKLFLVFAFLVCFSAKSQFSPTKNRFKVAIIDQSIWGLKTIRFANEFYLGDPMTLSNSIQAELGYNYHSTEDKSKARGFYLGFKYNKNKFNAYNNRFHGSSIGLNTTYSAMNLLIASKKNAIGIDDYYEFEFQPNKKIKTSLSYDFFFTQNLSPRLFLEYRYGFDLNVSQVILKGSNYDNNQFNNIISNDKIAVYPFFNFGINLGFRY